MQGSNIGLSGKKTGASYIRREMIRGQVAINYKQPL